MEVFALELHSFFSKKTIHRFLTPHNILGQKAKSSHQCDSNEPSMTNTGIQKQDACRVTETRKGPRIEKNYFQKMLIKML